MSKLYLHLLPTQQKDIFQYLKKEGFDPREFKWEDVKGNRGAEHIPLLRHIATEFYFMFDYIDNAHWASFSPGNGVPVVTNRQTVNWDNQKNSLLEWLVSLKLEVGVPTYWDMFEAFTNDNPIDDPESILLNIHFEEDEKNFITENLNSLRTSIADSEALTKEQFNALNRKIDYLIHAADKQGKVDWKNIFVGTAVQFGFAHAVSPEAWNFISKSAHDIFERLYNAIPILPPHLS